MEIWPGELPPPREDLLAGARVAEGLLCLLTDQVDSALIDACPALRAISNYAVGTDNVDLHAAGARGIPVGHTPDVLTEATADMTFALLLAAARRLDEGAAAVRAGEWLPFGPGWLLGRDLSAATLGIVGLGRIGRAVARRAEGFGLRVVHSTRGSGLPLEELLRTSDFVTLHCPLTPETHHLIGERELRLMKSEAVLVNTARGPVVDTAALTRALHEGWIGGAALDVTDPEPLPAPHPLLSAPNLLVIPHLGSATHGAREAMADLAVDNLLAALDGRPMLHCVNPEALEQD